MIAACKRGGGRRLLDTDAANPPLAAAFSPYLASADTVASTKPMKLILVPTEGVRDWQRRLADPEKHWRTGYSARALAHAWEDASGLPPEVAALLGPLGKVELLLAIPEYDVPLPGGERPSQNDVFALVRTKDGLIVVMVEGKVSESFGPTLEEWRKDASAGKTERLAHIKGKLGLANNPPPGIRYQLLHRAASAVIRPNASTQVMPH